MRVRSGEENLERMEDYLHKLKAEDEPVDLVLFSELCPFGPDPKWAEPIPGDFTKRFCSLAEKFKFWLVPGSINENDAGRVFNTALVINPRGEIVSKYRKAYPWKPLEKSDSGTGFCVFDIPGKIRFGLCICYDQWFPEVTRQLTWMGAEAILCPTMTGTPDRPLELVLSRANAIANQVYFINLNGLKEGGNGQSLIVGPEGEILSEADREEAILTADLDSDHVHRIRENGTLGVSQVLKSFREESVHYPVYHEKIEDGEGFKNLGLIRQIKTDQF